MKIKLSGGEMYIHALLEEFAQEIRLFEQTIIDTEDRINSPSITPEQKLHLSRKKESCLLGYKRAVRLLCDVCDRLQNDLKKTTNIRDLRVYRLEKEAVRQLTKAIAS
jgi:hypothetical protein